MRKIITLCCLLFVGVSAKSQPAREKISIDDNWQFAFGDASSAEKDFGCGTEYFNYITKAASVSNEGPYVAKFDITKYGKEWTTVDLPHDWVVDLPFAPEASHSHGYKTVGYKYPETSVGWYRKTINFTDKDLGKRIYLQFDGIFRDAIVWFNGFYLGRESSGYATQIYDISDYINYDGENLICVRCDASLEEGWFYEGAGIYRHAWLCKQNQCAVAPFGTFVSADFNDDFSNAEVTIQTKIDNQSFKSQTITLKHHILDADNQEVAVVDVHGDPLLPMESSTIEATVTVNNPHLWSLDDPYRYTVVTEVYPGHFRDGEDDVETEPFDTYVTKTGFRQIKFDPESGFYLNGKSVKLKGVNMHQDHAGVGSAIDDALQVYRIKCLKSFGCNAYRASHNPMTPEMLDACDSLGMLVIEENRLAGINEEHLRSLTRMIERDRNHPSIILWSMCNEEWGIEGNILGERIVSTMREYTHRLDPTRMVTVATSGGPNIVVAADVAGYNYIVQNAIDDHKKEFPARCAVGTEETSGCGTRGIYATDTITGLMMAHNRRADHNDQTYNVIERGWKFYDERPWTGGLFYWTGFDYRGEPNPMHYPSTGSQYGLLDYCGFPKDEVYYLKSWWTDETTLYIFPNWNNWKEGEKVSVWCYSNCDEVELFVNGKSVGRKKMEKNGHLEWSVIYSPGNIKAIGYKDGKKITETKLETTTEATQIKIDTDRTAIKADNHDISVVNVSLLDKKSRFVPDACEKLTIKVSGNVRILGVGNGSPAFKDVERPTDRDAKEFTVETFNGLAQILIQNNGEAGEGRVVISAENMKAKEVVINAK